MRRSGSPRARCSRAGLTPQIAPWPGGRRAIRECDMAPVSDRATAQTVLCDPGVQDPAAASAHPRTPPSPAVVDASRPQFALVANRDADDEGDDDAAGPRRY